MKKIRATRTPIRRIARPKKLRIFIINTHKANCFGYIFALHSQAYPQSHNDWAITTQQT
jgi:hypothetical protein